MYSLLALNYWLHNKGIDTLSQEISTTDHTDFKYNQINYFKYLFLTLFGRGMGDKIKY